MNFRSLSPHISQSCYSCRYFKLGGDMLNGTCHYLSLAGKSTIGIGTCDHYTSLPGGKWSKVLENPSDRKKTS